MSGDSKLYMTIVVGTDGSERADAAVERAIALAKKTGGQLHVVQAVRSGERTGGAQVEADGEGGGVVAAAQREGVVAEMHHPVGDPADGIVKVAEDVGADLIVLGNRGMTGVTRFVHGSVPNKVAHNAPCSLLIVDTRSG